MRRFNLLILILALGLAAGPAHAQPAAPREASRPFTIYMVLWRGVTEIEEGFKSYLTETRIPFELVIRDIGTDRAKLPALVREINETRPDLVYTWGTSVTLGIAGPHDSDAPDRFVRDIPVVFTLVAYPVEGRIVPSLESSGRNVTGVAFLAPVPAQVRAIQAYRPFTRLGVVYNPAEENSLINIAELRRHGRAMGFTLIEKPAPLDRQGRPRGEAVPDLVAAAKADGAEMLYIGPDSFTAVHIDALTGAAILHRLPTFAATELPMRGSRGLMGLVSGYFSLGKLTAFQAEQILVHGREPSAVPVASLARYSFQVNMAVAREIEAYPPMKILEFAEIIDRARAPAGSLP